MVKIFVAVLVACVVMVVVFQVVDPNVKGAGGNAPTTLVSDDNSEKVTISGQVTRPGTYTVDINSTLGDLISVASGITSNADDLAFDTSYIVENGGSYYIAQKYDNTDVCTMEPIDKVNINLDGEEELQRTKKVTATIAKAIIAYRESSGLFNCLEDLKNVKGIGNATFEKLKDYVRLKN